MEGEGGRRGEVGICTCVSEIMYILPTRLASCNGILCSVYMSVEGRAKLPL